MYHLVYFKYVPTQQSPHNSPHTTVPTQQATHSSPHTTAHTHLALSFHFPVLESSFDPAADPSPCSQTHISLERMASAVDCPWWQLCRQLPRNSLDLGRIFSTRLPNLKPALKGTITAYCKNWSSMLYCHKTSLCRELPGLNSVDTRSSGVFPQTALLLTVLIYVC